MSVIINPGSGPIRAEDAQGWTNTYEGAVEQAQSWLAEMTADGIRDVELILPGVSLDEGRWRFTFHHTVTGVDVHLDTHGIDDMDAYTEQRIFAPRVYWNGSSSGTPSPEDWEAPGFELIKTYRRPTASRWWVSWYSAGAFEYHGPWWISGSELGGRGRSTIVAAVVADSAEEAQAVIVEHHDNPKPEISWRFVEPRGDDWSPFGERFPRADWMQWPDPNTTGK